MKTTFKFIIAAMAASAVFASCQKELATGNPSESTDGIRVISASFSAPTKSALDDKTPKFVGGEIIKVSNETASENCTISVTGGVATFSTTLTGPLTAVYPSTAAKMTGNIIDLTAVLVSTVQDGTFANANIAMATDITTSATFTNKTAVIKITPGAGAGTKYVEVITAGPQIANSIPDNETTYTSLHKIHVATTSADAVYVSILVPTGLKVRDLSFADGHNIKTAKDNTNAIAVNTLSTVSSTGWDTPYVEIEMTVNSETKKYKWAKMNIGAASSMDAGLYFMWGETSGLASSYISSTNFPSSKYYTNADNSSWKKSIGFGWDNCPWTGGVFNSSSNKNVFTKYIPSGKSDYWGGSGSPDNKTTLDLADDAANVNWGGSWRMPTQAEFDALKSKRRGSFSSGCYFGDSDSNQIFLPAAGDGNGAALSSVGVNGRYWSSSLDTDYPDDAYYLYFYDGNAFTSSYSRYYGRSVRALSE